MTIKVRHKIITSFYYFWRNVSMNLLLNWLVCVLKLKIEAILKDLLEESMDVNQIDFSKNDN